VVAKLFYCALLNRFTPWPGACLGILLVLCISSCTASNVAVQERSNTAYRPVSQDGNLYLVKRGDTLSSIARRFDVSVGALQSVNRLSQPDQLDVGDRLQLPPGARLTSPGAHSFIWPLTGFTLTSAFGSRNGRHKGVDLYAVKGTPIRAVADGVVHFSGRQSGYGRVVIVQHANNVRTLYAHNHRNKVKAGQRVVRGQTIATVGKSGNASGYHLHFEYIRAGRPLDPQLYLPRFARR
jgi:murein DD-endopeptidase MepM/ murein hydrolase activator NlpD